MDYLINEQEDKARELLHQLFIEKARAIHEELMSEDDMEDEDLLQKPGLGDEIEHHIDEVEMEQHYGTMEDVDLNDAVDDLSSDITDDDEVTTDDDMDADEEDMDGEMDSEDEGEDEDEDMDADEEDMDDDEEDMDDEGEMGMDDHKDSEDQRISDLEQEIEDLKALYADIKSGGDHHEEEAHKENDMEESWMDESDLEEEFSDLEESLELDNVSVNAKKAAEVGSGKFARPESNTKSAVASNAPNMNGAKPVVTKGKVHSGYDRESAPTSGDMKHDSRVIKRTPVSKEGSTKALINKDRSEGFGAPNQKSPLGSGTTPKK